MILTNMAVEMILVRVALSTEEAAVGSHGVWEMCIAVPLQPPLRHFFLAVGAVDSFTSIAGGDFRFLLLRHLVADCCWLRCLNGAPWIADGCRLLW